MKKTLFEMKAGLQTLGQQMAKVDDELTDQAMNPKATAEDIKDLRKQKDDLQQRFDVMKSQFDKAESEQKQKLAVQKQPTNAKDLKVKNFADVVRTVK